MATQLVEFQDGLLVEVDVQGDQVREVSGRFAQKVGATFEEVRPLIVKACRPIVSACQELNRDVEIDQAEVELGLSFEGEGNIYITKAKSTANLTVKLVLKPKPMPKPRDTADGGDR